jgi:hypothetical protein
MSDFIVKFWYPEVVQNLDKVVEALQYYDDVWLKGQKHLIIKGGLIRMMQEHPDMMRTYADVHTDASMIYKWLDEQIKYEKASKRRWYLSSEAHQEYGEIRKTDVDMYVNSDSSVKALIDLQLMVEMHKRALDNLVQNLERRGIYLAMISKVRMAGDHEAFIDSTHETRLEEV